MIHGVVLKDMVIERLVPAVAPERRAEGLLPYRAHAYREALATPTSSATTMVVHSSRDTMMSFPSALWIGVWRHAVSSLEQGRDAWNHR